jgi:hypothetical protein
LNYKITKAGLMYRHFLVLILFLGTGDISLAQTTIKVYEKEISINNISIQKKSKIDKYVKALGEPSRIEKLSNNIYVFDALGLYIYERPESKDIIEISIDFKRNKDFSFSPKEKFEGIFYLNKDRITKDTSYKQWTKIKGTSDSWIKFGDAQGNYGDFLILLEYGLFKKKLKNITIDLRGNN